MSMRTFAFIAEGEVFMRLSLDPEAAPENEGFIAGLQSAPEVIDITEVDQPVERGWMFSHVDGFHPPVE